MSLCTGGGGVFLHEVCVYVCVFMDGVSVCAQGVCSRSVCIITGCVFEWMVFVCVCVGVCVCVCECLHMHVCA